MWGAVKEDSAESQRQDAQGQLLQDRGAEGGMLAAEADLRLDLLLPGVQILLDLAGKDLAELRVDADDVRGQHLDGRQQKHQQKDERSHGRRPRLVSGHDFSRAVNAAESTR